MVAATIFMYGLCVAYAMGLMNVGGGFAPDASGGGVADGFAGTTGYNEIETTPAEEAAKSHQGGAMNL